MVTQSQLLAPPLVHLVDDDSDTRAGTARWLGAAGYAVRMHTSASGFLAAVDPWQAGCVLLDLWLPDGSGFDVQDALAATAGPLPIVFVTARGDVPQSVRAIRAGAVDFLLKPVPRQVLLGAVARALARNAQAMAARVARHQQRERYARLTPREREVFSHLISGQMNKEVAHELGTAERTIKAHRRAIMEKLQARSVADLVRASALLEIGPVPDGDQA